MSTFHGEFQDDQVVVGYKPKRPAWMDEAASEQLPETLKVRQVRLRVKQKGFRTKTIVVTTTLLQPRQASRQELTDLYRQRWHGDLDLRSLKETMQMSILRGKTPTMVRKEPWAHFLA